MRKRATRKNDTEAFTQRTVLRVMRLIRKMRHPIRMSREEYAAYLGVSERSVYRYFNLIESLGYVVVLDANGNPFIAGEDLRESFTDQEAEWVQTAMEALGADNPLTQSVIRKLNMFSEGEEEMDALMAAGRAKLVGQIADALFHRTQITLVGYHSANSGTRTDRLVEPLEFVANYATLSAFEVQSRQTKYFRIDRISSVQSSDTPFQFDRLHEAAQPDMFGFALPDDEAARHEVRLNLSMRAALFLRSEYPLSIPYISVSSEPGRFLLTGPVADLRPLDRFIRGFPDPQDIRKSTDEPGNQSIEEQAADADD